MVSSDTTVAEDGVRRRVFTTAVSILLAVALLYLSVRGVDWRAVWGIVRGARWIYLAAGALLTSLSFFLRAVRWRILLNAEARLPMRTVFFANMAGYLGNNYLPARAGELLRSYLISTCSSLSKTYVLTTALGERMMDAIALVLASSVVLIQLDTKPRWMDDVSRTMAIVSGLGAVAIVVIPHTGRLVESALQKVPLPTLLRRRLLRLADQILLGLKAFHDWRRLAGFVALTVLIWMMDVLSAMAGAHALELKMTFTSALLLLASLGLSSALPSTPGYVGIYQFVAVNILPAFGMSRDQALAYILVMQASIYAVVTVLGLPALYHFQSRTRRSAGARATQAASQPPA
jgi:uncharacterized protein (TIRG00374 family)